MKKQSMAPYFFLFLFFFLFLIPNVHAAKKIGTCVYQTKNVLVDAKVITLSVTLNDDGTITDRYIQNGDWKVKPEAGLQIGGDSAYYTQYKKMFDQNGRFYKAYQKEKNCPQMYFYMPATTMQVVMDLGGGRSTTEVQDVLSPDMIDRGDSTAPVEKEKKICSRVVRVKILSNSDVTVTFKKKGGTNYFHIDAGQKGSGSAQPGESVTIERANFTIREKDWDAFFKNTKTCEDLPLYLHARFGDSTDLEIQTEQPDVVENGSYNTTDAEEDTGHGLDPGIDYMPGGNKKPSQSNKPIDACQIIGTDTGTFKFLKKVIGYIQIGTVFLVLVLGMVDLAGAVGSAEEGAFKKAGGRFGKRLIAAALVFLVPALVNIILFLINDYACKDSTISDLYDSTSKDK